MTAPPGAEAAPCCGGRLATNPPGVVPAMFPNPAGAVGAAPKAVVAGVEAGLAAGLFVPVAEKGPAAAAEVAPPVELPIENPALEPKPVFAPPNPAEGSPAFATPSEAFVSVLPGFAAVFAAKENAAGFFFLASS